VAKLALPLRLQPPKMGRLFAFLRLHPEQCGAEIPGTPEISV